MSEQANPNNSNPNPTPEPQGGTGNPNPQPDISQALAGLLSRNNNDANAVSLLLFNENKGYRDEIRDLKTKVPKGDMRVLTREEAEAYDKYVAFGPLDELGKRLKQGDEAITEVTGLKQRAGVSAMAKAESLPDNDLLALVAGKTQFIVKPVETTGADGKKTIHDRAFVVTTGDDGKPQEELFEEWVKTQKAWQDALPALRGTGQAATPTGVILPAMPAGGNDATQNADRAKSAQNAQRGMLRQF